MGLSYSFNGSFIHSCFYNVMYWSFGKYQFTELYTHMQHKKITFVNITTVLIRKILSIWKLSSSWWHIQIFKILIFFWKNQILLLATNIVSCFPCSDRFMLFTF